MQETRQLNWRQVIRSGSFIKEAFLILEKAQFVASKDVGSHCRNNITYCGHLVIARKADNTQCESNNNLKTLECSVLMSPHSTLFLFE